jgi:MFS family permease
MPGFRSVMTISGAPSLFLSSVLGRLPQGIMPLGTLLLVHDRFDSFAVGGVAVGGFSLGIALGAPVQGSVTDAYGPRRVLPLTSVAQAVASIALALAVANGAAPALTVVLAVVAGLLIPPISASVRAVWMALEDPRLRERAFGLDAVSSQLVFALGPLIAGAMVVAVSPTAAVLLSAGVAVAGGIVILKSSLLPPAQRSPADGPLWRSGLLLPRAVRSPALRAVLVAVAFAGAGVGTLEVGLPALMLHLGSRSASGLILGLWALGGIVGGWLYGSVPAPVSIATRYRVVGLVAMACALPLCVVGSVALALAASLVAGLPWAAIYACHYRLIGEAAPPRAVTESFTWMVAALVAGIAGGSAAAGALISGPGVAACFAATVGCLVATIAVPLPVGDPRSASTVA